MRFKEGDKVEFIDQGELKQGVVTEIKASNFDISYQVKSEFMGTLWVTERDLVAPTPVLKVPQFAGDWISRCKQKGYDLFLSIDYDDSDMPYEMYNWLTFSDENQELFARAWLDGYEVEKEPLYYVQLITIFLGYLNERNDGRRSLSDSVQNDIFKTQFTEAEIKEMDERYWQFAVLVEEVEGEA
ncbi:TPA: DUF1642 domain-containing protein [Listeria monocytogenes]|uniref:DUF1642 domain-containing protein n=1 Tax=Listeria monocytogenes TaxID=1639 RepID=UPI0010D1FAA7|nr:DUF1642 domain-containing protein [Listeria monocytogenes]EAE5007451.1 DUF1642 domain-containing protein [Listeria monocytogenes]EHD4988902.1 DUF1642 domain-containing protein [Listeria monocytogenes]MCD7609635.1 DUF1642 domain-containing protein [Listeria monocytogenes]MCE8054255.1 DUF1642 domain-containing protein [Listeria monocytogenes]HAA6921221.1 DUF1642 domain-containing protein [Listeria monocytogenes]